MKDDPVIQNVRANGGDLVHLKPFGTDRAICGREPKNTATQMKRRGYWYLTEKQVTCKGCLAKMKK